MRPATLKLHLVRVAILRGFLIVTLLGLALAGARAQAPKGPKNTSQGIGKKDADKKKPPDKKPLPEPDDKRPITDKMNLPSGAIVIVVEGIKEALAAYPKYYLIAPEKLKEMQDLIRKLENKLKAEKKAPHACKLSGKVEGDFVFLQSEFLFTTETSQKLVVLGLQGANLTDEGELDRKTPLLDYGPEGFVVQVDNPGAHQLTLNLKLPVGLKRTGTPGSGSERGFELGLPGAAVTTLSLELPNAVNEVRWNDHVEKRQVAARRGRWELALGKIKNLNFSWKEPVSLPGTGPLLTSEAVITVKVEENQVLTVAELKLGDLRGQAKEWHLLLPAQAKVEIKAPAGLLPEIVPPDNKNPAHIIRLTEPSSEHLQVTVQVHQARTLSPLFPIGPFILLSAFEQQGTIVIKAPAEATRGLRLLYHRHGAVYQREIPPNQVGTDVTALFYYEKLPNPVKAADLAKWAPLILELKTEKGLVETQVEHVLRLSPAAEGWQVDLTSKIKGKSLAGGVDFLDVQLPRPRPEGLAILNVYPNLPGAFPWAGLYLAGQKNWPVAVPAEFSCQGEGGTNPELQSADDRRRVRITLNRSDTKEFIVVLTGRYGLPALSHDAFLELPLPLGILDRGGKVTVIVDEQLEILPHQPGTEDAVPGQHQQTSIFDQSPKKIEIAWRPYRPEMPVTSVADVTVHQRNAHVRQQMHFPFSTRVRPEQSGKSTPDPVLLRIPAQAKGFKVIPEGRLLSYNADKKIAWINPPDDPTSAKHIELQFDFSLPAIDEATPQQGPQERMSRTFAVPLVWPAKATHIDAKVRVWCDPGIVPVLAQANPADERWRDQGTEVVEKQESLPGLVVHGSGLDLPLALRLLEGPSKLPAAVFDQGLLQVKVNEEGHHYRARFLVRKLNTDHLLVKLPGPVANLIQSISLKERIDNWSPLESDSHTVRIPVKAGLHSQPLILDLEYKVPSSQLAGERGWQTTLHPPDFRNEVFLGQVRWQVSMPSGTVAFVSGGSIQPDYRWELHNWLLTPEPGATGEELERWLTGSEGAGPTSSFVFWRTSLDPLKLWHFPRQTWFLICSGLVLAAGLGLSFASLSRFAFWALMLLVVLATMVAGQLWPALLPALAYGGQPGLLVLVVILGIQWMLQERYRRQVVFMPGFTRLKSNSSLVRPSGGSNRPREQPSTVDAPAAGANAGGAGSGNTGS